MVLGTGLRKEEERIGFADQICRRDGSTRPAVNRLTPIIWPQRREGKLPVCRVVDSSMEYRNGRIDRYCKFKRIIPIHSFRSGVKVYKRKRNFAIFIDPIQLPSPDENIVSFSRIGHISSEPVTAVHSSFHRPMNAFTWPASPVYFGDNLSPSGRGNPKK